MAVKLVGLGSIAARSQGNGMTQDTDKKPPITSYSEKNPQTTERPPAHPDDREHEGATEDEMTPIPPPNGPEYDDEPKQG